VTIRKRFMVDPCGEWMDES